MSIMKKVTFEEEMQKNPQLKLSDVQLLREWCKKQPHLPEIEDSFLVLFLHRNYYQIEPTKNTIETYYTFRTHTPEYFCNRDPLGERKLRQAFKTMNVFPLNEVTKDGYKIIYVTILNADPLHFNFDDNIKANMMLYDMFLLRNGTDKGHIYIVDVDKISFSHIMRINLLGVKKLLYYVQKGTPLHIKEIHVINTVPALELLMNMIKPFMKKELLNKIHFHLSINSVSEYIPVDALPNEVGGKAGSVYELAEIEVKKLEDYREWFLLDEVNRRVNEALRIGKSNTVNDLFGVEGSFKKIEID